MKVKEAIEILNDREKKHFNIIKHTFRCFNIYNISRM